MGKVYCKNCKFVRVNRYSGQYTFIYECRNDPEYDPIGRAKHDFCEDKNSNFDCKEYKRKWYKFWVK